MSLIRGSIKKGLGESNNTVKAQMPFFMNCFPEVANCKRATINILLEKPLVILHPDFTTEPLPWHPAFKVVKGGEIFKFLRIKLKIDGHEEVDAWVYKAQFSPYYTNPFYIEVLAEEIGFNGTPDCEIKIVSNCCSGYVVVGDSRQPARK